MSSSEQTILSIHDTIAFLFNKDNGLFSELKEIDVDSIGTTNPTKLAKQIIEVCKEYFIECDNYVFWSTRPARIKAYELHDEKEYMLDKNHELINSLFEKWCEISGEKESTFTTEQMVLISYAISRLYAMQATKNAIIFLGSDKSTEKIGFHVGNNLWQAELFVLRNICKNISFIVVDNNITCNITTSQLNDLPIWRREYHTMDDPTNIKSFVKRSYKQSDYDEWRKEPPRKGISYGDLHKYCLKWKKYQRK